MYEHLIDTCKVEEYYDKSFSGWYEGSQKDMEEYFHYYCSFLKENGYDIVPFECCVGGILPGGGVAAGTGNSIPSYVPLENYLNMIEIVREYRGDFFNP